MDAPVFPVALTVSMLHKAVNDSLIIEDVAVVVDVFILLVTVTAVMIPNALTIYLTVAVLFFLAKSLCLSLMRLSL